MITGLTLLNILKLEPVEFHFKYVGIHVGIEMVTCPHCHLHNFNLLNLIKYMTLILLNLLI